jgi:hypothetical protein
MCSSLRLHEFNVPTERRSNKQLKKLPSLLPARRDPIVTATFLLCTQTFDDGRHMLGRERPLPAGRHRTRLNECYPQTFTQKMTSNFNQL